jgi:biopolymer transport protein TolQ
MLATFNIVFLPVADMLFAFRNSNFVSGKLFVFVLFVVSIYAWSVMITKYLGLRRADESSRRFIAAFRQEPHPITLFLRRQEYPESPLFKVYVGACRSVGTELEARGTDAAELLLRGAGSASQKLNPYQMTAVRNAAERAIADQAMDLENRMGFLATAASAAPLLGLLGTVWGVMDTFSSMAVHGAASIAAVAPGISGALMTTGAALVVAIPSAVGYNLLTGLIRKICIQMDNFADEFMESAQRVFMRE